jgi:hypothetical protein
MLYNQEYLLPIDFDEAVEQENKNDAKKLAEHTRIIKEISQDLGTLIDDAKGPLIEAEELTETAEEDVKESVEQIDKAQRHHFRSKLWKSTLFAGLLGFFIGGPVGGIVGGYTGASVVGIGLASACIGGVSASSATYSVVKNKINNSRRN